MVRALRPGLQQLQRAWALEVIVVHGLGYLGACGIFQDQRVELVSPALAGELSKHWILLGMSIFVFLHPWLFNITLDVTRLDHQVLPQLCLSLPRNIKFHSAEVVGVQKGASYFCNI